MTRQDHIEHNLVLLSLRIRDLQTALEDAQGERAELEAELEDIKNGVNPNDEAQ